jgi:hypothetical protein
MTKPKKKQPLGQTIGGVLFGFEQQVLRTMPPPQELVHHARPDDPVPAGDGGFVTIEMPDAETPSIPSALAPAPGLAPAPAPAHGADPRLAPAPGADPR